VDRDRNKHEINHQGNTVEESVGGRQAKDGSVFTRPRPAEAEVFDTEARPSTKEISLEAYVPRVGSSSSTTPLAMWNVAYG